VVDDQSQDNTFEVAKAYAARDTRVRVLQNTINAGPYVARNLALENARGLFVTVHDADDWSHPRKIERQVQNLLENPELIANTSQMVRLNPTNLQLLSSANQMMGQSSLEPLFQSGPWIQMTSGRPAPVHPSGRKRSNRWWGSSSP
jgi:glycosyltransferase involved in cell wall biosynthesis